MLTGTKAKRSDERHATSHRGEVVARLPLMGVVSFDGTTTTVCKGTGYYVNSTKEASEWSGWSG